MTTAFLFVSFLLAAAFFALAAGELRGIRQTVQERADRLTAELHTVEAVLAEHREALDGLKFGSEASDAAYTAFFRSMESSLADLQKDCKQRYGNLNSSVLNICHSLFEMGGDVVRIREIQKGLENQDAVLNTLKDDLSTLTSRAEAEDAVRVRFAALAACLEELQKTAPAQTEELRQLRGEIGNLARDLKLMAGPISNASDLDARLSKSMEEGIMNLMQYAAGKTSGGVEVGLG